MCTHFSIKRKPQDKRNLHINIIYVLFICCIFIIRAHGQSFPVKISIAVQPPYYSNINIYIAQPNKIMATLINTSSTVKKVNVQGKLSYGGNISIYTNPRVKITPPVDLYPNIPLTLNQNNISQIFEANNLLFNGITKDEILYKTGLFEGDWTICLIAYDYETGIRLSADEPYGCSTFTVSDVEPPTALQPVYGDTINPATPQLLDFVWTTPAGAPRDIAYKLQIFNVMPGTRNINDAVNSGILPLFFETTVNVNSYLLGSTGPSLVAGSTYAFLITAISPGKMANFRNKGMSEIGCFTWGKKSEAVTLIKKIPCNCGHWDSTGVRINGGPFQWINCPATLTIHQASSFNFILRYDCTPNTPPCSPGSCPWQLKNNTGTTLLTGVNNPAFTINNPGVYFLKINAFCSDIKCDSCPIKIIYDSISDTCKCLRVAQPNMKLANVPIYINNTYTGFINDQFVLSAANFSCFPSSCPKLCIIEGKKAPNPFTVQWQGDPALLPSTPFTYTFLSVGSYTFRITRKCGLTVCEIDTVHINITKPQRCQCTGQGSLTIITQQPSKKIKKHCGGDYHINNPSLYIKNIGITGFGCLPICVDCNLSYTWKIVDSHTSALIAQGTGDRINFPVISGNMPLRYNIIFQPVCGGNQCSTCILHVFEDYEGRPK